MYNERKLTGTVIPFFHYKENSEIKKNRIQKKKKIASKKPIMAATCKKQRLLCTPECMIQKIIFMK